MFVSYVTFILKSVLDPAVHYEVQEDKESSRLEKK